ncbi:helix-turn-helix domain-containing protein [Variovorax ureilyticus]
MPSDGKDSVSDLKALFQTGRYTRVEMAERLGLSERTLYRRLKALGLN